LRRESTPTGWGAAYLPAFSPTLSCHFSRRGSLVFGESSLKKSNPTGEYAALRPIDAPCFAQIYAIRLGVANR
jgi:hypothetical protein